MKPFYTNQMLVECNTSEIQLLRIAVSKEMTNWSDTNEYGNRIFDLEYKMWSKLYKDLTKILEQMPWDLES